MADWLEQSGLGLEDYERQYYGQALPTAMREAVFEEMESRRQGQLSRARRALPPPSSRKYDQALDRREEEERRENVFAERTETSSSSSSPGNSTSSRVSLRIEEGGGGGGPALRRGADEEGRVNRDVLDEGGDRRRSSPSFESYLERASSEGEQRWVDEPDDGRRTRRTRRMRTSTDGGRSPREREMDLDGGEMMR